MKAKEYLLQLEELEEKIKHRVQEREELKLKCEGVGAIRYDKDKVQTSVKNLQEELIAKYIDLEREINTELFEFLETRRKIIKEVESLSNVDYVKLLHKRHIEYKKLDQIAEEMHFEPGYIRKMIARAYEVFEKNILREEKHEQSTEESNGEGAEEQ